MSDLRRTSSIVTASAATVGNGVRSGEVLGDDSTMPISTTVSIRIATLQVARIAPQKMTRLRWKPASANAALLRIGTRPFGGGSAVEVAARRDRAASGVYSDPSARPTS